MATVVRMLVATDAIVRLAARVYRGGVLQVRWRVRIREALRAAN